MAETTELKTLGSDLERTDYYPCSWELIGKEGFWCRLQFDAKNLVTAVFICLFGLSRICSLARSYVKCLDNRSFQGKGLHGLY